MHAFYHSDDINRQAPGRKDRIIIQETDDDINRQAPGRKDRIIIQETDEHVQRKSLCSLHEAF